MNDERKYIGSNKPLSPGILLANNALVCGRGFCTEEEDDMPKWRKLWVKITSSFDVGDMPDHFTRLCWTWLPLVLSCEGTAPLHSGYIRGKLFPLCSDVTDEMVGRAMEWFVSHGMLETYNVDGRDYIHMVNFSKYQGNTNKEADSDFPPMPIIESTDSGVSPELVQGKSRTDVDVDSDVEADEDVYVDSQTAETYTSASILKEETGLDPLPGQVAELNQRVEDLRRWRECTHMWVKRGYNPSNTDGMLEWYDDGIPDSAKQQIEDGTWQR